MFQTVLEVDDAIKPAAQGSVDESLASKGASSPDALVSKVFRWKRMLGGSQDKGIRIEIRI